MSESDKNAALDELISRVIVPYACVGFGLLLLGLMIRFSPLPEINTEKETGEVAAANATKKVSFNSLTWSWARLLFSFTWGHR